MSKAFSFNREFDFVRLDGLRRATGRPAHEWDIYIVKELIDNALDADESLWRDDPAIKPSVRVRMEYIQVPALGSQQLFVEVSNQSEFPIGQIADIFATQWYTSNKTAKKGLTRGALGNALKTLLGIPFALRHRLAGNWQPDLAPLSIRCRGKEYLPRYVVDATAQSIDFECRTKASRVTNGTVIRVGLDHFSQEIPRTLANLELLAEQYHLCNPHVTFHWTVEIDDEEWEKVYQANEAWQNIMPFGYKFLGTAPVLWYPSTTFQYVLGALYRQHHADQARSERYPERVCGLPLERICHYFAGFDKQETKHAQSQSSTQHIIEAFGKASLTAAEIESEVAMGLYQLLCQRSPVFDSIKLGQIGKPHIEVVLSEFLMLEGEVFYEKATDAGDDPNVPFVIEVAVARLKEDKRQIWTALNFTPTYGDPFHRRWLRGPDNEPVLGLRGLLDAYGFGDDEPFLLFLHLICPNIEHHEFSKTEINHLPFKEVLCQVVERLLTAFRQAQEEAELRLEQVIFQALDAIMRQLAANERFVFEQLVERLHIQLRQEATLATWLATADAHLRLRTYISNYQSRRTTLTHLMASRAAGRVSIPLHPDRHFELSTEHLSSDVLRQHHVNKILYIQVPALEAVVIENGWLCQMDMALLHNAPRTDSLQTALVQCVARSDLPILLWHNADQAGQALVEQMQTWLAERQLDAGRIKDIGLSAHDHGPQPTRLIEMMPKELHTWLTKHLNTLGLPIKSLPTERDIRRDIRQKFEDLLKGHLWEGISQQWKVSRLLNDLDQHLQISENMAKQMLDQQLKDHLEGQSCPDSYATVLNQTTEAFFERFMEAHRTPFQQLVQTHLADVQLGGE